MTPYRRAGSKCWMITIVSREGAHIRRSSGTHDRETADAMQLMLTHMARRGTREWDLIDAVLDERLSIGTLYDHHLAGTMDLVRAQLQDRDLAPAIDAWEARIRKERAKETSRKYAQEVLAIFPRELVDGKPVGARLPVMRSTVTRGWLKAQLAAVKGSNTNRRRYAAAWTSCLDDLVESEFLEANPMNDVSVPASNPSRTPHLLMSEAQQLVGLIAEGAHRALSAFRHGAGVELQAAIDLRRRDIVDEANRVMWAHGRKNTHRDRQVIVEPWAFAVIMAYVRSAHLLPDAPLFGVTLKAHRKVETEALKTLATRGVEVPKGYTLHAACHTFCVDAMKRGVDPVLIANNRGHANTQMVLTLYGKFRPAITDLLRADQRSARGGA